MMLRVSKWKGRPRLAKRDGLGQASMLNFAYINYGGGGTSAARGQMGPNSFKKSET